MINLKNKFKRKELALAFLFFVIFLIPFVFAKPLISEAPTDLSYRSGLEVKTEYRDNGAGLGSLISETNYYYEFHPITPQARQNINPIIGCDGAIKGTPPKTYCAGTPIYKETNLDFSDLTYRGNLIDANNLYWRAYAAGFKTYQDIDYSLASYLSSKAIKSVSYGGSNHQDTFSQTFYDEMGSVIAEVNYGKINTIGGVVQRFLSHTDNAVLNIHNAYRGFLDTGAAGTTKASSLEGFLDFQDINDQSEARISSISYAPDP